MAEKFIKALNDIVTDECDILLRYEEEHEFSESFERDMKRLVSQRKKPYFRMINTVGKRVACVAAVLLIGTFTTVMNVEAARSAIAEFFIGVYEKFSTFISADSDNEAPEKIEQLYEITCGLDGFVVNWEVTDDLVYNVTYLNEPYIVDFKQSVKSEYDTNWNTEDTSIETIMIDEYEAVYFCDNHNYHHLLWSTDDYVFSISTNVGKNALIGMSNYVQKVE